MSCKLCKTLKNCFPNREKTKPLRWDYSEQEKLVNQNEFVIFRDLNTETTGALDCALSVNH